MASQTAQNKFLCKINLDYTYRNIKTVTQQFVSTNLHVSRLNKLVKELVVHVRGASLGNSWWDVRPVLQILTLYQTKKCYFPHPFSDQTSKIHTRFQTSLWAEIMLSILRLERNQKTQNFNPVHSAMLFSQRFFCRPLLLPPCTVPCKIVLASPDDLDTCPNHFNLRLN